MADAVDPKLCEEKHKNIDKQLTVGEQRMNSHSESVHDVKEAIVRLTIIQEMQTNTQAAQTRTLEGIDKRVSDLEDARVAHLREQEQLKQSEKFWQTTAGQRAITVGAVITAIVILAAIGQDIGPEIKAWLTGK